MTGFDQKHTQESVQKPIVVKQIEFETANSLKNFLESLFQLKPKLMTSFAIEKLRIVIEMHPQLNWAKRA